MKTVVVMVMKVMVVMVMNAGTVYTAGKDTPVISKYYVLTKNILVILVCACQSLRN